jgi:hypothetical protein
MTDSDRLIARLNLVDASLDDRLTAVILLGTSGIEKALDYCDALEVVRQMGAYQPACYVVDAAELLF